MAQNSLILLGLLLGKHRAMASVGLGHVTKDRTGVLVEAGLVRGL